MPDNPFFQQKLLLASSSTTRRDLLQRLHIPFHWVSPDVDETPHENESPTQLVQRLATDKAKALTEQHPDCLIIGADQVASSDREIFGKPKNHQDAIRQLTQLSGSTIDFHTGICLISPKENHVHVDYDFFRIHFRNLTESQIVHYLEMEKPYHCAASFKSEGLGVALIQKMCGNDHSTLLGLSLIKLIAMLEMEGLSPL